MIVSYGYLVDLVIQKEGLMTFEHSTPVSISYHIISDHRHDHSYH
jgi:hypothetical protein